MFRLNFPREFAVNGKRLLVVHNIDELAHNISKYIRDNNLYTTVYSFGETNGHKAYYNTAVIDRVFIDVDNHGIKGEPIDAAKETRKIADYLLSKGYLFNINFSGRGYHIFIYTSVSRSPISIKNFAYELIERAGASVDTSVIGDLAREVRILNTINQKSGLYCIPVRIEEIGDKALELAKRPRNIDSSFLYGKVLLNLSLYDTEEVFNYSRKSVSDFHMATEKPVDFEEFYSRVSNIPCINEILDNDMAGWQERSLLLSYMKYQGYTVDDAENIIKSFINKEKYNKSVCVKNHARSYYSRTYLVPSCHAVSRMGLCPIARMGKALNTCLFYNKLSGD
jgi:hypothetical protein